MTAVTESPAFDAAQLLDSLKAKREPITPEGPVELAAPIEAETGTVDLAADLTATPAPAVGTIAYAAAESLAPALQGYAGTGAYARGNLGREEIRATLANVDRESIGRYLLTVDGARSVRPDAFVPPAGAGCEAVLPWLANAVSGLRAATGGAILVVVTEACGLEISALEAVAVEADCLVAVLERRPGLVTPVWEPRLLDAKPALIAEPVPEPRRSSAVARAAQVKGGWPAWFAGVSELVQGYPEAIPGPRGERLAVAYGKRDDAGCEYVELRGHTESADGRMRPIELEPAPGVKVDLADVRVYV